MTAWCSRTTCGAAVLLVAAAATGGCGSSSSAAPTILNTEKVERAIESSIAAQRGARAHVSCPAGVHQKQGLSFTCSAVFKTVATTFSVTQLDGAGHVHYEAR